MEYNLLKNKAKSNIENITTTNDPQSSEYNLMDIYLKPEFMQIISQQLAGQPKVDFNKVKQLKSEIQHSTYHIDFKEVAEIMINFEKDFFK